MNVTKFSPFSIAQLRPSLVSELRQWLPLEFEGTKLRRLNFDEHTGHILKLAQSPSYTRCNCPLAQSFAGAIVRRRNIGGAIIRGAIIRVAMFRVPMFRGAIVRGAIVRFPNGALRTSSNGQNFSKVLTPFEMRIRQERARDWRLCMIG